MASIIIEQCQAKTRKGDQCSRKGPHNGYCYQHKPKTVTKKSTKTVTKKPTKTVTKKPKTVTKKPTKTVTKKPTKTVTKKPTKTVTDKRFKAGVYPGLFQTIPSDIMNKVLTTMDCNSVCNLKRTCMTYKRLCYRLRPTMLLKQTVYHNTVLFKDACNHKRLMQKSLANDVFTCPRPTSDDLSVIKKRVHKYVKYTITNDMYLLTDNVAGGVCCRGFLLNIYHLFPAMVMEREIFPRYAYYGYYNSHNTQYLWRYCETVRKSSGLSLNIPIDFINHPF